MGAAAVQSAFAKMYKTVYMKRPLTNFSLRTSALGQKIKKESNLKGNNLTYPINWGRNWGISTSLTATKPASTAGSFNNWVIPADTPSKLYGRLTIDIPTMMRAEDDIASFLRVKSKHMNELFTNMTMIRLGDQLWSDGAGNIAQIESVTGSNPITAITLTSHEDAVKFDGSSKQQIQFAVAANRASGGLKADGTAVVWIYQVDKVNRYNTSGKAVLSVTRIAGTGNTTEPAATDYIYNLDQYGAGPKGIPAWIPDTDPSATLFFGVDRSVEPQMLAGWRGPWEGTINASIQRTASIMGNYIDPKFTACWLSSTRWYQLKMELEAEGRFFVDEQKSLEFGTTAIRLFTTAGMIPVLADAYVPSDSGFLLRHDDIYVHSTGELIHLATEDIDHGGLRLSDDDGLEYRWRSLAQYRVDTPYFHGRFPITMAMS